MLRLIPVLAKFGTTALSDEDLLLRIYAGEDAVKALPAADSPQPYLNAKQPLVRRY